MQYDVAEKGWPVAAASLSMEMLGSQGWNVLGGDLPLPVALLKESALATNEQAMARFLANTGTLLCPHGKTTMSVELMRRQIAGGAWGITAATVRQMMIMHSAGIRRVLIANQVVGACDIAAIWALVQRDPEFDLYVLADSVESVTLLARGHGDHQQGRLNILLEVGQHGARTGARDMAAVWDIGRAIAAAPSLSLRGVETYEGIIADSDPEVVDRKVNALYRFARSAAAMLAGAELFGPGDIILSGGGSVFYDLAAIGLKQHPLGARARIVLRSGCYLTHDSVWLRNAYAAIARRSPELASGRPEPTAAIEVWAHVQSMPESGRAYAAMGKRDVSFDLDLPVALHWHRPGWTKMKPAPVMKVTTLNDQHAYLDVATDSSMAVGDMIGFGISHPCTTFDKWRLMPVVDDDYNVIGAVRTHF